jgi:hypothetical protein
MSSTKRFFIPLVVILVVFLQLAVPRVARADDTQPPEETETAVPVDPGSGTGDPVAPPEPAVVDPAPAEPAADETLTVPEILDQAPAGTEIAVVNDQGNLEPLATQEAAEIIATGDPIWCPEGQVPTPGANGCTPSFGTMNDLVSELSSGSYAGNGTIWVETAYNPALESGPIVFSGGTLTTLSNLTIQGGWSGTSGDTTIGAASTFTVPISVINWASDVTLNNISVSGSTGYGVYVNTTGDITLDTVSADGNASGGAVLSNYNGTGDVEVTGGEFDTNGGTGLEINSAGTVTVDGIDASGNTGIGSDGLAIDNTAGTGTVTVTNSTLNNNGYDGLSVVSNGNVYLSGLTVGNATVAGDPTTGGNRFGAFVETSGTGTINVETSTFSNNSGNGLVAVTDSGNITLSAVYAEANGTAATSTSSGFFGLGCTPQEFNGGIWLRSNTGIVTVQELATTRSTILGNHGVGLQIDTGGAITVQNSDVTNNASDGASLSAEGTITVTNSTFDGNGDIGLYAVTDGNISATDVTANSNVFAGAWLESYGGTISVTGTSNTFANNGSYGLKVFGSSTANLVNITATGNGQSGIYINYLAPCGQAGGIDVTVTGSLIELNGAYGIQGNLGPTGSLTVSPAGIYGANNGTPPDAGNNESLVQTIHPCPPPEPNPEPEPEKKPFNEVEVPDDGSQPVEQDCEIYAGLIMTLPNGDDSQIACPAEGTFTVQHVAEADLPGTLPAGPTFLSALTISGVDADGNPILVLPDGASLVVSFEIPEGMEKAHFAILYWDESANDGAGKWVELPRDQLGAGVTALHPDTPEDNMLILRGVREDNGKVTVKVNFTGTFVLIAK